MGWVWGWVGVRQGVGGRREARGVRGRADGPQAWSRRLAGACPRRAAPSRAAGLSEGLCAFAQAKRPPASGPQRLQQVACKVWCHQTLGQPHPDRTHTAPLTESTSDCTESPVAFATLSGISNSSTEVPSSVYAQ